jgi:hypothetical protein
MLTAPYPPDFDRLNVRIFANDYTISGAENAKRRRAKEPFGGAGFCAR